VIPFPPSSNDPCKFGVLLSQCFDRCRSQPHIPLPGRDGMLLLHFFLPLPPSLGRLGSVAVSPVLLELMIKTFFYPFFWSSFFPLDWAIPKTSSLFFTRKLSCSCGFGSGFPCPTWILSRFYPHFPLPSTPFPPMVFWVSP